MPRRSAADAQRTRDAIVERAVDIASSEGLEGVTIGRLADDLGMSKAGILNHYGSKEALQLAAVETARRAFVREVWDPTAEREPGLERLVGFLDAWITSIAQSACPGGCFWAAASTEWDGRPGPVRDAVVKALSDFEAALVRDVRAAVRQGELPAGTDVAQVVFELRAIGLGLNQDLQLHGNEAAERRARKAVRRSLGVPDLPLPRRRRVAAAATSA